MSWINGFTIEWRNPIGCLKLQVIVRKRATSYRALLRKMTYKDKASFESLSLCMYTRTPRRNPVLYRSFSAKEPYNEWLFFEKRPATEGILWGFATLQGSCKGLRQKMEGTGSSYSVWMQVSFCKRATDYRALWQNMTYKDEALYSYCGEDAKDALKCRSFFAKEPLITELFGRKWPMKMRHRVPTVERMKRMP